MRTFSLRITMALAMILGVLTSNVVISTSHADTSSEVVVHVSGVYRTLAVEHLLLDGAEQTMVGTDDYGSFALVSPPVSGMLNLSYIGRKFDPIDVTNVKEVWLPIQGTAVATSRAVAQGYVAIYLPEAIVAAPAVSGDLSGNLIAGATANGYRQYQAPIANTAKTISVTLPGEATAHKVDIQMWGAVWLKPNDVVNYYSQSFADGFATIHYHRPDAKYDGWVMHLWDGYSPTAPAITWSSGMVSSGADAWGVFWKVPLAKDAQKMSYIIHKGDTKDVNADQALDLINTGGEVWFISGNANSEGVHVYTTPVFKGVDADLKKTKAIWLTPNTIAWPYPRTGPNQKFTLLASKSAGIDAAGLNADTVKYPLTWNDNLSEALLTQFPYLIKYASLTVPDAAIKDVKDLMKGQLAVSSTDDTGVDLLKLTGVQLGDLLDSVYDYNGKLGITFAGDIPTLKVWAPTAQTVTLVRYLKDGSAERTLLTLDSDTGVWTAVGKADWKNTFFNYEVNVYSPIAGAFVTNTVIDPYSVALSTNSKTSMIADLNDPATMPANFKTLVKPKLNSIADTSIYELQVRDFSATDASVPVAQRGKYLAFTAKKSNGMKHLADLAKAGLTHIHLLPIFDFATVNENPNMQSEPNLAALKAAKPVSDTQQKIVSSSSGTDAYNWGYDPLSFNVPEGSYASNAEGATRTKELRSAVASLNSVGLRVIMDVVYNHTNASGQSANSTFDKIVPGYYYRLAADGTVFNSTCCANTATERKMMAKFVRESILLWATQYKIDGFRFDIMGHMPKELLVNIRKDLDALTLKKDGIEGSKVVLYGEGWNFGEVASNARFVQATQAELAGTGIGTFNDRLRDAVRGGGTFDTNPNIQGYGSGLYTNFNGDLDANGNIPGQKLKLLSLTDRVKLGLVGQLTQYQLVDSTGEKVAGADLAYNGQDSGYTASPIESINYVDSHDNLILFDSLAYKLPLKTTAANRARYQVFSLSTSLLSQGIPFMAAGSDLLHSKSLDKDSYDSGDWFNAIDWTGKDNGLGHGLPNFEKNGAQYSWATKVLNTPTVKPLQVNALAASAMIQDLLKLRYSSPLFRLGTAKNVMDRVQFLTDGPNQIPGVIVMRIVDQGAKGYSKLADLDKKVKSEIVVFNGSNAKVSIAFSQLKGLSISLNPIQKTSSDPTIKSATFTASSGTLSVPAISTAVFTEN